MAEYLSEDRNLAMDTVRVTEAAALASARLIGNGDEKAAAMVRNTATLLGIATANLSVVIDPSLVILGGGLIAQAPSLVSEVQKIVSRIVPMPSAIVASPLGQEAPLWGSLHIAMDEARDRLREQVTGLARPRTNRASLTT